MELAKTIKANKDGRTKRNITFKLSNKTITKLKELTCNEKGRGYTSLIGRIVEEAVKDPKFLKKCL